MQTYTIKPLIWVAIELIDGLPCDLRASSLLGEFAVYQSPKGWRYRFPNQMGVYCESEEHAKAMCDSYWQERMKAGLVPVERSE